MTEASKGGAVVAEHIASYYRENPHVKAVLIGGSVSRNWADVYSDLELGIFWDRPPSDRERRAVIEQVGGELWMFHSYRHDSEWVTNEHWGLEQVNLGSQPYSGTSMISTNHFAVSAMEQCLVDVVERYDTALKKQVLIAAIQNGIPLYGTELLQRWQIKAASFPDELAIKIVQENLFMGPWFCPEAYIGRDDFLVLFQHYVWAEQCILRVLAALNRVYYISSEHKWMDAFAATMSIVPPDLSSRMKHVFRADDMEGWHLLKALIYETIDLVDEHLAAVNTVSMFEEHPEVNTTWARKRWETHHSYTLFNNVRSDSAL
jgi:hypothetical protein